MNKLRIVHEVGDGNQPQNEVGGVAPAPKGLLLTNRLWNCLRLLQRKIRPYLLLSD